MTSAAPRLLRRELLALGLTAPWLPADALEPRALQFPRDHGSHPLMRTEWWYITGHLRVDGGGQAGQPARELGFQITFFRSRVAATQSMQSRFAAKQLLFAHAAITDVQAQKLWHDQRIAREGFGVATASEQDTALRLRDWSLARQSGPGSTALPSASMYAAHVKSDDFAFALTLTQTQPLLLQGRQGLSRKGPQPEQASFYYSKPQLRAQGTVQVAGKPAAVQGVAWLDHEWSNELLHPLALGWDWIGMNLDDGSALTAFRLRDADGQALWDGGSFRSARGELRIFERGEVVFTAMRRWTSPSSQASYPVEWQVQTPNARYTVRAVMDAQELDSRASTGAIYWEGLSDLLDMQGRRVGRGYLEMTGYASPLRL